MGIHTCKTLNHKNLFNVTKLFHSFFILTWFWVIRKPSSTFSFIIQLIWTVLMNWLYKSLVKLYFLHFLCAQNFKDKNHWRLPLCVFSTKIVNEFTWTEKWSQKGLCKCRILFCSTLSNPDQKPYVFLSILLLIKGENDLQ